MAASKNDTTDTKADVQPDAETAEQAEQAPSETAEQAPAAGPTHRNQHGDPVHIQPGLHAFVEGRGFTPIDAH
jgi:hypothetical protein